MKVTGGASNLINGVSRQSPDVRLTTQLEDSVNQWPTITRGLVPRNPAVRRAGLPALRYGTLIHIIDRDDSEQYVAEIGRGDVRVWDLDGNPQTVNAPNGFDYLSASEMSSYRAVTAADHTFILNRDVTVAKDATRSAASRSQALVHVVQGSYHTTYTIKINGSVVAELKMGGGPFGDDADAREIERYVKASCIASALRNNQTPEGAALPRAEGKILSLSQLVSDLPSNGTGTLNPAEWSVRIYGNVLHIVNTLGNDFTIDAYASDPNLIRAHKGTAPLYSELPGKAPNGFSLKINGDESSSHDDYYVVYTRGGDVAEGRWKETRAPDTQFRLDASTMPHLLVREANGTFTFKAASWVDRMVGDDETNPWPSFVGSKVSGIIYAQNRLGLFSGESVAMSRHNAYFSFFKESLLSRLDTDPVDLTIAHPEVSTILHGVPMGDEIVLFTQSVQFRMSADGARLTNDNGSIKPILSSRARSCAAPVVLGSRLYFANDAPSGSFVHEFDYDRESGRKADEDITAHVQGYLPPVIDLMAGDSELRTLVVAGSGLSSYLYVYRWMTVGNERVQSAWQRWAIPGAKRFGTFSILGEELVIVAHVAEGAEILTINLHEGQNESRKAPIYLDRQVTLTGQYDRQRDRTIFELPYAGATGAVRLGEFHGAALHGTWDTPTRFAADGYIGTPVILGASFESYGILSPLLYRTTNNQGSYGNAVPGVDTWVSSLSFGMGTTAYLEVDVERRYRTPYRTVLSPPLQGTETGIVGVLPAGRPNKSVSIMAKSEDVTIRFGSGSPHGYAVTGLSWSGNATPTAL